MPRARVEAALKSKKASKKTAKVVTAGLVHAPGSHTLTREQRALLAEALRRAEETRNVVEDALLDFGRWVLVHIFEDDAKAALEGRRDNPLWVDLLGRAGGPTLGLSTRFLYVAVSIAAHDKRIQDGAWRLLEPGRKEILLPLGEEDLMRKAAQHVVAMKLSQRATREYVRSVREASGRSARVKVSVPHLKTQVRKFSERFGQASYQRKAEKAFRALDAKEKAELSRDLEALRSLAARLLKAAEG